MKKDYLKKLAALSVAAAMVFSMAACGNTGTGNNAGNASESSSAAAENTSKKDNKKLTKITFCLDGDTEHQPHRSVCGTAVGIL